MTVSEIALMKAAQRFAACFQDRVWDEFKRLDATIDAWRELAKAALEYAQSTTTDV